MILKCTKCGRLHDVAEWKPELTCSCSADQPTLMLADQDEKTTPMSTADDKTTPLTQSGSPTVQDDEVTVSLGAARGMRSQSVLSSLHLDSETDTAVQAAPEKYEYLQPLGAGGMGEVVRAFDRDLHRFVAVKRLRSEIGSRNGVLRFVTEAQVTGQLELPHIVPVHELGLDSGGRLYFWLQLIEGE